MHHSVHPSFKKHFSFRHTVSIVNQITCPSKWVQCHDLSPMLTSCFYNQLLLRWCCKKRQNLVTPPVTPSFVFFLSSLHLDVQISCFLGFEYGCSADTWIAVLKMSNPSLLEIFFEISKFHLRASWCLNDCF